MRFRAVCTDIDGTLLNADRQLSARTIRAFRSLPTGVPVILASSRMPSAMRHLQDELGVLHYPLICYNGGYVIRYNGHAEPEVIHHVQIPLDIVKGIVKLAAGSAIHTSLYYRDQWFAPARDHWAEREATITKVAPIIMDTEAVLERWSREGNGAHKVMCMGPEDEIDEMEQNLNRDFSGQIHIYRSRPTYLELAPASISKGSALRLLLKEHFAVDMNEVIAFGDNYNDIELLSCSGHGVAVANSRPEVISVANEVTINSREDGVALSLEKHFGLNSKF